MALPPRGQTFFDVITAAIADMTEHGFDSNDRLLYWLGRIRDAASSAMTPAHVLETTLQGALRAIYTRMVERGQLVKYHRGVGRFTLDKLRPQLHGELDRRILASASLIRLNRQAAIEKTLQRFSGWSTSIPAGGTRTPGTRKDAKDDIRKAMASLPFEERRVLVDQGHKFTASLSDILATDGGAVAATWHSHWRQANYNYREDHKERDQVVYAIKGNWALERGLMRASKAGYTDQITKPGEEVYCRCYYSYIYNLRDLPDAMLTAKGRAELKSVRIVA